MAVISERNCMYHSSLANDLMKQASHRLVVLQIAFKIYLSDKPASENPLWVNAIKILNVANKQVGVYTCEEIQDATLYIRNALAESDLSPVWKDILFLAEVWANGDELLDLTTARKLIFGDDKAGAVKLGQLIQRGALYRYADPAIKNPQQAGRVSRKAVEALLEKRMIPTLDN